MVHDLWFVNRQEINRLELFWLELLELLETSFKRSSNLNFFPFQFTKPQILFVDVNIGQLDYFMHGLKRRTDRKKSIFRKKAQIYKAVSSTENETLLFPEHIDTEICRRIAICLAEQRTS